MFQIYFSISTVILAVALSIGLISGLIFRPLETYTMEEIFKFAGVMTIAIILLVISIIVIIVKKRRIKIEKDLIKEY